jgi:serine/threonine protein kinase
MASKPAQAESVGWTLGTQLGQGGQGSVFRAVRKNDPDSPQHAFKFLNDNAAPKARDRFRRELQAVTSLNHPSIVKIVQHAQADDSFQYYVMAYVDGIETLRKRMDRHTNPFYKDPTKAVDGFIQIVEALALCEKHGIIHRDLSPANMLVTEDGGIVLIDFGLCHIEDDHMITLTEEAVGTPHYRAPECSGYSPQEATIKADLYSAGKLLWSMITNKLAFDREKPVFNDQALALLLPHNPMAWHLHHIFEKSIRHNPSHRYPSATEALVRARDVKHLISAGYRPLELLTGDTCHICGVGKYGQLPAAYQDSLYTYTRHLSTIVQTFDVCSYCFHLTFRAGAAQYKVLESRKLLE